jgi:hypothetical protein
MKNLLNIILRFIVITLVTVIPTNGKTPQYHDSICNIEFDIETNTGFQFFPKCIEPSDQKKLCKKVKITPKALRLLLRKIARVRLKIYYEENRYKKPTQFEPLPLEGIMINTQGVSSVQIIPQRQIQNEQGKPEYEDVLSENLNDILNIQCID